MTVRRTRQMKSNYLNEQIIKSSNPHVGPMMLWIQTQAADTDESTTTS